MDPKRDFRLPCAAALASQAKQFGISVATLKTLYKREWEDGTGGGAAPTRSQPGRAARTNPRYPNHDGTRSLDLSSDEDVVGSGSNAAYCLPCLAEAEAFNITDVDGGQSTGLLYKIPAGTLCRSCKQGAISRFIPHDVEGEKTVVRYKVFKGLVGAKGGISGKYTEWSVTGVEYGKGTKLYTMKVVYNVVTIPTVRYGQWDWPRDFQTDIKKWPRRPPPEYAKPRTAIDAKLETGLRLCWKKQYDAGVPEADLLVSAEIAMYMRNVANEEVRPAATSAGSPAPS
eukprot:jgi/Tetstr1/447521/TSEL_034901.t1